MKRQTRIAIILFLTALTINVGAEQIDWITDLDQGLEKAAQTGQNLFVLITAPDWCGYCIQLEEKTLPDSEVISLVNEGFVPVMITDENPDVERFYFPGYPTIQILGNDEKAKSQLVGFNSPKELMSWAFDYAKETSGGEIIIEDEMKQDDQLVSLAKADAVLMVNKTRILIFKGKKCLLYDVKKIKHLNGYPKPISDVFPGIEGPIDAAVNWGNGKYYLFSGDQYWRINARTTKVDDGFPKPFNGDSWKGLDLLQ